MFCSVTLSKVTFRCSNSKVTFRCRKFVCYSNNHFSLYWLSPAFFFYFTIELILTSIFLHWHFLPEFLQRILLSMSYLYLFGCQYLYIHLDNVNVHKTKTQKNINLLKHQHCRCVNKVHVKSEHNPVGTINLKVISPY